MVSFEYALMSVLVVTAFPFSMVQMGVSLDEADLEGFSLWVCIASLLAGIPVLLLLNPTP
ncbi:MAG: hypothetical protein SFW36_16470 [Leptolyngbyaceae cyanobacterium bins.59]|nr:hypothetical protein [Leptolyngbyaceae cyanobacterium bins.59]